MSTSNDNLLKDLYDFYGNVRNAIDLNGGDADKQGLFYALQCVTYCMDKVVNTCVYQDLLGVQSSSEVVEEKSAWCDLDELCRRHPELLRSKVKSRKWRLENDFPCNSEYKCHQMYYDPDVCEWIQTHLKKKYVS